MASHPRSRLQFTYPLIVLLSTHRSSVFQESSFLLPASGHRRAWPWWLGDVVAFSEFKSFVAGRVSTPLLARLGFLPFSVALSLCVFLRKPLAVATREIGQKEYLLSSFCRESGANTGRDLNSRYLTATCDPPISTTTFPIELHTTITRITLNTGPRKPRRFETLHRQ